MNKSEVCQDERLAQKANQEILFVFLRINFEILSPLNYAAEVSTLHRLYKNMLTSGCENHWISKLKLRILFSSIREYIYLLAELFFSVLRNKTDTLNSVEGTRARKFLQISIMYFANLRFSIDAKKACGFMLNLPSW